MSDAFDEQTLRRQFQALECPFDRQLVLRLYADKSISFEDYVVEFWLQQRDKLSCKVRPAAQNIWFEKARII